ncbi:hypothetical protein ACFPM0_23250 [Pseudonocardia sulfidoxydans]
MAHVDDVWISARAVLALVRTSGTGPVRRGRCVFPAGPPRA